MVVEAYLLGRCTPANNLIFRTPVWVSSHALRVITPQLQPKIQNFLDGYLLTVSITISQAGEFDYSGACWTGNVGATHCSPLSQMNMKIARPQLTLSFQYCVGSQALKALKEQKVKSILINPNVGALQPRISYHISKAVWNMFRE